MLRTIVCLAALLASGALVTASAQTAAPEPKLSKMKLTVRKEVKSKGLAGDDRWFYIEDCMAKT
jgi:hypothetical protein